MLIEINLSFVGMAIIILSWIVQIVFTFFRGSKMTLSFAILQAIGIVLLVVDNYMMNSVLTTLASLNIASALGAFTMAVLVLTKKQ